MTRTSTFLCAAAALAALVATADARPVVRAGVPADSLTPADMDRVRVRAPSVPGQPVRLTYAAAGTTRAQVLIDVVVAADGGEAKQALTHWRHQLTRELDPVAGIGDEAYGTGGSVAFVRDNVMIAVRCVGGSADVTAIAVDAARAVAAAPTGRPRATASSVAVPRALAVGEAFELAPPAGALAADLRTSGPVRARRTATGWRLTRTGDGAVDVTLVAVDELLRVAR